MINRLLLCTDMDRTVIPNGHYPEHPEARARFRALCALPQVQLVYVSGRHLQLVEQAIVDYSLPVPDYVIADVGTNIYRHAQNGWQLDQLWKQKISAAWQGKSHDQLHQELQHFEGLTLQEPDKQGDYKLSYYIPTKKMSDQLSLKIRQQLENLGIAAELIWSIDEIEQIGLLDILPRNASKRDSVAFLQSELRYSDQQIIFAGDSGNDLPVLVSPIRSVLVANAKAELKNMAIAGAKENSCTESLYIAEPDMPPYGGYYSAGVLQGVGFFYPEILELLD